jgi:hypothetical protein
VYNTIKQEVAVCYITDMSTTMHNKDNNLQETCRILQWNDTTGLKLIKKNDHLLQTRLTIEHESQSKFEQVFI